MKDHYELHEGISGSGNTIFLVVAVDADGNWIHTEKFASKAEALNWMKWA